MMLGGRQGPGYIVLRVQREPLDQTDLSNGLDASSKVVGDHLSKLVDRWGCLPPPWAHLSASFICRSPTAIEDVSRPLLKSV